MRELDVEVEVVKGGRLLGSSLLFLYDSRFGASTSAVDKGKIAASLREIYLCEIGMRCT